MTSTPTPRAGNGLDLNRIRPDLNARYSPNLYGWLRARYAGRKLHRETSSRAYIDCFGVLWIGRFTDDASFVGQRLHLVLDEGAPAGAMTITGSVMTEVADFWSRYMQDGRCAIDPSHTMPLPGDDSRWSTSTDGNKTRWRQCCWCNNARQVFKRETSITVREGWV